MLYQRNRFRGKFDLTIYGIAKLVNNSEIFCWDGNYLLILIHEICRYGINNKK